MYLHTLALSSNSTSPKVPLTMSLHTSTNGVLSKGNTFIASGSPNLALYSIKRGPSAVSMNWPYKIPLYGSASSAIALIVSSIIFTALS